MADVSSEAKYEARPCRSPPLASTLGETPQSLPGNASSRLTSRRPPLPAPPAALCCRGPGTAQLQHGPMATQPRHRPASAGQWWHGMGTALILRRPIAACAGTRPPSAGRSGRKGERGEAVTGSAPLPSDPVSRFSVFLFQTTWTRRGCEAAGRNPARHCRCRRCCLGRDPCASQKFLHPSRPRLGQGAHMATQAHSLSYVGCNFLRQRLVLSTLSGRPVKIRKIRARDDNPGLRGDSGRIARGVDAGVEGDRADALGAGVQGASGSRGRVGEGWCGVAPAPECA